MFAQKFADILRRHRVIFGEQVFANTQVPRDAEIFRLRQILLNLTLRLREAYVSRGQRPEQAARALADTWGPLRATAATLLELEGRPNSDQRRACGDRGLIRRVERGHQSAYAAHERKSVAEPRQALVEATIW